MSTIDEVLAAAEVVDAVCVIDGETRIISVPNEYKELGVESDEKVTRIKFRCPKIVGDNVDLTEYNLYINYRNAGNKLNSYLVEDVTVTGDTINFSWLLSRHVTESPGTISYIVCAKKSDNTGVINEWNTKVATGTVGIGLEATEEIEEQNIDVIEQILRSIVELENKVDSGGSGGSGGYYAPAVDADGNLSWTASKADMPTVDGANIKGPQGKSGVYVGSGDMPDGYNVQIDPDGTPSDIIPTIDETLTEHGKAADAKATGDAIRSLSEEIANLNANGISATARNLLITILRNGVYISDQNVNITDLETALGGSDVPVIKSYAITNTLTNCTTNNAVTSVTDGGSYTATLTAADGYELDSVTVTMGGIDITSTAYSGSVITIASVTGDISIVATAVAAESGGGETVVNLFDKSTMVVSGAFVGANGAISTSATSKYAKIPISVGTYALQKGSGWAMNTTGHPSLINSTGNVLCSFGNLQANGNSGSPSDASIGTIAKANGNAGIAVTVLSEAVTHIIFSICVNGGTDATDTIMMEVGNTCHDYVAHV